MRISKFVSSVAFAVAITAFAAGVSNTASASTVTFNVTGPNIVAGSTWSVNTANGQVLNEGLHGSANITLTGLGSGAEGAIDGNYDTDDHGFFFRWAVLGAFPGPNYGLIIPDFYPAFFYPTSTPNFIGFTGGTFNDAYIYYNGDNNLPTGLTVTFTEVTATPLPSTWLMLLSGFLGLGYFAYRGTKKRTAVAAA